MTPTATVISDGGERRNPTTIGGQKLSVAACVSKQNPLGFWNHVRDWEGLGNEVLHDL
jgi:hypothetical protein